LSPKSGVGAEQAEQRAAEVLRHVDRRDGRLGIYSLFVIRSASLRRRLGAEALNWMEAGDR
jgi:hypothetical protein